MEELIVRIENVLRKKEGKLFTVSADSIALGKYRFYTNRQLLASDKEEKKLSYRESELLKILYENRDRYY